MSSAETLSAHLLRVRRGADRGGRGGRVPRGQQRAQDRLHDGAAEVALQVGRSRRHPCSLHRHGARERVRGRGPRESDADADQAVGQADLPVRDPLVPQEQHRDEPEQAEDVADQQREPRSPRLHQLRRARSDQHHAERGGQDRHPGVERVVAEHVLQELLAHEHRSHQRAEHDDAGARGDPEDPPSCHVEVVQRVAGSALPDDERDPRGDRDRDEPEDQTSPRSEPARS